MHNYSTIKRRMLLTNTRTWRNLKGVMLLERSEFQKVIYYLISSIRSAQKLFLGYLASQRKWSGVEEGRRGKFLESRELLKCTSKKIFFFFTVCLV